MLAAFQKAFGGRDEEVNYVDFEVGERGDELFRRTVIRRRRRRAACIRNDGDPACLTLAYSSVAIRMR